MTLPSSSFGRVTHTMRSGGAARDAVCVYAVRLDAAGFPADWLDTIHEIFGESLVSSMTTDWGLVKSELKVGPDETGPTFEVSTPLFAGTDAPPTCTPQVAYLLTKRTSVGGRRGRGRMYLPGVKESNVDGGGNLSGGALAALQVEATELVTLLAAADLPMVLEHGPETVWVLVDGQPRRQPVPGPIPDPDTVNSLTASSLAATQRRRLR